MKIKNGLKLAFWSITAAAFWMISTSAQATTYYVRTDGGTSTQCTGMTNAAYPGTGTAPVTVPLAAFTNPDNTSDQPGAITP